MPADVSLQSLEFKMLEAETIASVRVTLTHDFSSPMFEKQSELLCVEEKFNFVAEKLVRRILGVSGGTC